jgi:hypothetical protein
MDFVERLFHLSPDGGSGAYEAVALVGALVVTVALRGYFRNRTSRKKKAAKK